VFHLCNSISSSKYVWAFALGVSRSADPAFPLQHRENPAGQQLVGTRKRPGFDAAVTGETVART